MSENRIQIIPMNRFCLKMESYIDDFEQFYLPSKYTLLEWNSWKSREIDTPNVSRNSENNVAKKKGSVPNCSLNIV